MDNILFFVYNVEHNHIQGNLLDFLIRGFISNIISNRFSTFLGISGNWAPTGGPGHLLNLFLPPVPSRSTRTAPIDMKYNFVHPGHSIWEAYKLSSPCRLRARPIFFLDLCVRWVLILCRYSLLYIDELSIIQYCWTLHFFSLSCMRFNPWRNNESIPSSPFFFRMLRLGIYLEINSDFHTFNSLVTRMFQ